MDVAIKAVPYSFRTSVESQASPGFFQVNPTLADGDAQISKDGGAYANLATLPTIVPAGQDDILIELSATEMAADDIVVRLKDVAGAEWFDDKAFIKPIAFLGGLVTNATVPSNVTFSSTLTQVNTFFDNAFVHWLTGTLEGQSAKITGYVQTDGQFTVEAMTGAPAVDDKFMITGKSA